MAMCNVALSLTCGMWTMVVLRHMICDPNWFTSRFGQVVFGVGAKAELVVA